MAVYGRHGDLDKPVCFLEGVFYPVLKDEHGYDVPDRQYPLVSVEEEWHYANEPEDHNKTAKRVVPIVPN